MPKQHDGTPKAGLSRRRLISAAGVTAVGLATASTAATAHAEEVGPDTDAAGNQRVDDSAQLSAQAVPATTAGYSYFTGNQFAFHSNSSDPTRIRHTSSTGVYSAGSHVVCPLHIPAGTRVRELTIFATTAAAAKTAFLEAYNLDGTGASSALATVALPLASTPATPVTIACDFTVDASKGYDLAMFTTDLTERMFAFRIGMQPAAAFVPLTPYRAYDSRKAAAPNSGIMTPNSNRVVSIVNAIDDAGAIIAPNVIPSTARAVTYNITATLTTGDNFLAVAPGLAASTTVSAINFAANQTLANAATVSLDDGTVKVFCGANTGSSHFIIDITGYYI